MSVTQQFRNRSAFTLVELVVVLAVVFVLMLLLVPALAGSRTNSKAVQCLNNLRRLTGAWQMYASDNDDRMVTNANFGATVSWAAGWLDWSTSSDNTNTTKLITPSQSLIARYVQSADLFKCPADVYRSGIQVALNHPGRARSVSLNAALGGNPVLLANQIPGRFYFAARRISELNRPGPANTMAMLDEHPDSINDANFQFYAGLVSSSAQWVDFPASYHNSGAGISFADGRATLRRWRDPRTVPPVRYLSITATVSPNNLDYVWMNDHMPYK
jgi:prepilin-type processing-associated H-X9-DG protein